MRAFLYWRILWFLCSCSDWPAAHSACLTLSFFLSLSLFQFFSLFLDSSGSCFVLPAASYPSSPSFSVVCAVLFLSLSFYFFIFLSFSFVLCTARSGQLIFLFLPFFLCTQLYELDLLRIFYCYICLSLILCLYLYFSVSSFSLCQTLFKERTQCPRKL